MNPFGNLKLRWKLVSIVIVPIACMLYLAQDSVSRNANAVDENERLLQLSRYAVFASSLVHELQKERGASAGFLGSKGKKFVDALLHQRQTSDAKAKELEGFLKGFDPQVYGDEFVQRLNRAMGMYDQISSQRRGISDLSLPQKEAIAYFTAMNSAFLDSIAYLATISSDGQLSNIASAYINFLQSKERAGLERAVLTVTFSQDRFSPGVYDKFISLVTIQDTYINVFRSLATTDQLAFFDSTVSGKVVDETNAMRQTAIDNAVIGSFGVDASYWFKIITEKINLLKKVEDTLSNDLKAKALSLTSIANNELQLSITVMVSALLLTLLFVYVMQRSITKPIHSAVNFAHSIAEGNFDNDIQSYATDESGQLLRALKSMQDNLKESQGQFKEQMESEQQRQVTENNRIRQALNNVTANVMMADKDLNITYINKAVKAMFNDHEAAIKKDLPKFSISGLIGTNIDDFHKNPAHQRGMLEKLDKTYITTINVGGRNLKIIANPVFDDNSARLGTVVEWVDITEQMDAEKQVENVINAAVAGELDVRLDSSRYNGFMRTLADNINHLLNTIIAPLNVSADYIERISVGDIPEPIDDDYQGDFNKIKNSLNTCISSIKRLVTDTNTLASAAVDGQLDTRANEILHQGDFCKIIEGVNNALDAIVNPINECKDIMESLSSGDLTQHMQGDYKGEFGELKNSINNSLKNLLDVVSQVSAAAISVDTASTEIASGVSDLSQRTESQAASLEETAASMEQMTATVNNNADNAQAADRLVKDAKEKALEGGSVVDRTIESMTEINQSSKKITDIIGVIDSIAFQTNLLALNAAVEAARAGEQGRGFAVVAAEVRTLAQRSADAAGEIKNLIHDSVNKINVGSDLVNQSGETLNEIVDAVENVYQTIAEISTASVEQRSGISQIGQTITQMDGMTQQNAALVEEASAASQSMSDQASHMQGLLSTFKTKS